MPLDTQFDFKQLIQEARNVPIEPETGQGTAVELPALFEKPVKAPPVMTSEVPEDKVAIEVAMHAYSKVYTLWRPWEDCKRCFNDMGGEDPKVVLPDEGDYSCPHVQVREYRESVDRCLSGKGVITTREMFNLPNGARCVHLEWMESDEKAMAKLKRMAEAKKRDAVYPPDVEGAFLRDPPREPPKTGKKKTKPSKPSKRKKSPSK